MKGRMKILTGIYKGRNIFMPANIRPTQSMLRQAIFDILGQDLSGMTFLDLFAGSGSVGIEALSCGADEVHMVERDPKCLEVIEENILRIKPSENGQKAYIIKKDAFATVKQMAKEGKKFHVVFFDPPFDMRFGKKALKTVLSHDILHANSLVIAQYGVDDSLPNLDDVVEIPGRFSVIKDKIYGTSRLTVIERTAEQ